MNTTTVRRLGLALLLAALGVAAAQAVTSPRDLSAEQRQDLAALRDKLKAQGADRATCRLEHDKLLQSWGLEPGAGRGLGPCGPEGPGGPGGPGALKGKLTKAQRTELHALMERLDEQDADPELRRTEHDKLLRSWGLEPGAGRGRGRCQGCCPRGRGFRGQRACDPALQSAPQSSSNSSNAVSPTGVRLLQGNQPNPFNPETAIRFTLPEAGEIRLAVYDLSGSLVRELQTGRLEAGVHSVSWNGESGAGRPAASGTYLYRLEWQGHTETGRMTLLR